MFTYEYLLSACEGHADPRVLNFIYHEGVTHIRDNAFLFQQYGEFLEELNEYENAREMFKQAYAITPTDDLARSIVRVRADVCVVRCRCAWSWSSSRRPTGCWTR